MNENLINFDMHIGHKKPETIIHQDNACPFCDREHLTDILATDGDIILLRNKYNVLTGADQFVLIESSVCESDIPAYSSEHMHRLIRFGLEHWQSLLNSGKYADVLFFKNYGPMSGGTIRHPHMQLIGCPELDASLLFNPQEFDGPSICHRHGVNLTVSDHPRIGFWELNIIPNEIQSTAAINTIADFIQIAASYLMQHFSRFCQSYNIFFYHRSGQVYIKLMPRFATPPVFVGYGIRVRPTNIDEMVREIRNLYQLS